MASKVPPTLSKVGSYVKIANENASRDPVIYYWCLFYAVQEAMKIDKKSPDAIAFITGLLGTLEVVKKQLHGNEAITNDVVAQAHLENFAFKLFGYADGKEKLGQVDKAVVHAFYTAGHIMDTFALFGELDENIASTKKYAKWKCMQINQCLKDGTPYVSSAQEQEQNNDDLDLALGLSGGPGAPPTNDIGGGAGGNNYTNNSTSSLPSYPSMDPPGTGFGGQPTGPTHSNSLPFEQNYGGPQPPQYAPQAPAAPSVNMQPGPSAAPRASYGRIPSAKDFAEAKKFTKYGLSAIDYEDTKSAIDNLRKALELLES